jgi:hypothetical protein
MRYMMIVKGPEDFGDPPKALMDAIDRSLVAGGPGAMIQGGGLEKSNVGAIVRISRGKVVVTDGPFTEAKEVIGGFAIFELPSREVAVQSARDFMQLHVTHWPGWEGVCEVREMMDGPPPTSGD